MDFLPLGVFVVPFPTQKKVKAVRNNFELHFRIAPPIISPFF